MGSLFVASASGAKESSPTQTGLSARGRWRVRSRTHWGHYLDGRAPHPGQLCRRNQHGPPGRRNLWNWSTYGRGRELINSIDCDQVLSRTVRFAIFRSDAKKTLTRSPVRQSLVYERAYSEGGKGLTLFDVSTRSAAKGEARLAPAASIAPITSRTRHSCWARKAAQSSPGLR